MSNMAWSIGPSTHPVSGFPPRRPLLAGDRIRRGAAVADSAEETGGEQALGRAHQEIAELQARLALEHGPDFDDMVGRTPAMVRLHEQIAQVGVTDSTVLVTGETGTGKELVARAVHRQSRRRAGLSSRQLRRAVADARRKRVVRARARRLHRGDIRADRPIRARRTAARSSSTRWESSPRRSR